MHRWIGSALLCSGGTSTPSVLYRGAHRARPRGVCTSARSWRSRRRWSVSHRSGRSGCSVGRIRPHLLQPLRPMSCAHGIGSDIRAVRYGCTPRRNRWSSGTAVAFRGIPKHFVPCRESANTPQLQSEHLHSSSVQSSWMSTFVECTVASTSETARRRRPSRTRNASITMRSFRRRQKPRQRLRRR